MTVRTDLTAVLSTPLPVRATKRSWTISVKGDRPGHVFHGNQYSSGGGGSVYVRFGDWNRDSETSHDWLTDKDEPGVSVYSIGVDGNPTDPGGNPDSPLTDWKHEENAFGIRNDDTAGMMKYRMGAAEQVAKNGVWDARNARGHLVTGTVVGKGEDGEPLLKGVRRVGDWVQDRDKFGYPAHPLKLDDNGSANRERLEYVGQDFQGDEAKALSWTISVKGDVPGHVFHGNQYTSGGGGSTTEPVNSLAKHTGPDGKLTPERQALHDQLLDKLFEGHTRSDNPTAVFLGGGPASGKSSVFSDGHGVTVNADDFKAQLPEYQQMVDANDPRAAMYTHEESSQLSKEAIDRALHGGVDYTLDGTGDTSADKMGSKIQQAKDAGYKTKGVYVTIDTDEAVRRSDARAAKTGRAVPHSVITETHKSVSQVFPKVADKFDSTELWDNNGNGKPTLVGSKNDSGTFKVQDQALWQRFLDKGKSDTI